MGISGLSARLTALRRRRPFLDHLVRTVQHYGTVMGSQQAGAATYFGFLSVFPILALAVFVVGLLSSIYPDQHAQQLLADVIDSVMPGLVGNGEGQIPLDSVQRFSGLAAVIGVLGVLYAGLGWLSSLRSALLVMFELPEKERPNFVVGKLRDLLSLVVLGAILFLSVAVTSALRFLSDWLLEQVGLASELSPALGVLTVVLGIPVNAVLFFALFRLLAEPHTPRRALWKGALLGGIAFEVLKLASNFLISSTQGQPAFQVFGTALVLLVWIHYSMQVVLYSAAFAHTSREAREALAAEPQADPVQGPQLPPLDEKIAAMTTSHPDKKLGGLLLGVGAWNLFTWTNFAKNLRRTARSGEQRPRAYYLAHTVLIIANLAIGGVLGAVGAKQLKR